MADAVVTPAPRAPRARRGLAQLLPRRSPKLVTGLVITGAIVLFTVVGPYLVQDPSVSQGNPSLSPPSAEHLLGTTSLGHDVLSQLAHGGRGSLLVGLTVGAIALVLSLIFGIVSGYLSGWTDEVLSLITNVMLVIPGLPLTIVLASYIPGRSLWLVALVLGVTGWAGAAVVLRSQARSLRTRDYVAAAKVAGEKTWRIIGVEILPNLLPLVAAQFLFAVILGILGEAGLSYLGLGPTGSLTWGTMLNQAQTGGAISRGGWWWFIPPGLLIAVLGAGLSLVNFAIDEIINPKLRNVPATTRRVRKAQEQGRDVTSRQPATSGGTA
ncbi:ABC transporter permease [Georgenia satyanarayanai]|uniref:ABC transporter permease n=1 Tax=Georgenia satyanarayanai TaxID=860221 RepID=UPI00203E7AFE|nr:ABC transporter permease [Georgenia satyanarayanai]MCM3660269.1 ABC transporter permease [Georgenia satyanarayanai]